MNKQVQGILQKEMTRKEFMATLGFGVASVMGFGSLLKLLGGHPGTQSSTKKSVGGYGSSAYGGSKES